MSSRALARRIIYRLRSDYATPSRRAEYADILRQARDAGYSFLTLAEYVGRVRSGGIIDADRCFVLRHDIDIRDSRGNWMFYEIERSVGARSTYYFRLSTAGAHSSLIRRLLADDFEVGYHFEEASSLAKRKRLTSRQEVFSYRDEIVEMFRQNCALFRQKWNPRLRSVASHGDWINRRLGFINNEFLDAQTMSECDLDFESYDEDIQLSVDVYVSDVASPPHQWARDLSPIDAIRGQRGRIYMLTHERQWNPGRLAKARADASRILETLWYRAGRSRTRPAGAAFERPEQ